MGKIELTQEESNLYHKVLSFDPNDEFEARISKLESAKQLTELLLSRNSIPEQRIKYFSDKEYQTGNRP